MRTARLALAAVAAVASASAAFAAPIYTTADNRQVNSDGTTGFNWTGSQTSTYATQADVHSGTVAVYVFELPSLGNVATPFTDAGSQFNFYGWQFGDQWDFQTMNVIGLAARTDPTVLGTDFNAAGTTIQNQIMAAWNFEPAQWRATSGSAMGAWLDSQYADGANAGKYVFVRLEAGGNPWHGFAVDMQQSGTVAYISVPEPTSMGLLTLAGIGLIARRRKA